MEAIVAAIDDAAEKTKIHDPAYRQSFLDSVPKNARTLALRAPGPMTWGDLHPPHQEATFASGPHWSERRFREPAHSRR
jgi:hypothetical protein